MLNAGDKIVMGKTIRTITRVTAKRAYFMQAGVEFFVNRSLKPTDPEVAARIESERTERAERQRLLNEEHQKYLAREDVRLFRAIQDRFSAANPEGFPIETLRLIADALGIERE